MSVFSEEWRDCLREQYKDAIRGGDKKTQSSLTAVLAEIGFSDDELRQLRVEATMRAEDMPEDFVPDLDIVQESEPLTRLDFQPHPLECQCPECVETNLGPHDEDGQPLEPDDADDEDFRNEQRDDPDRPQQLTMF